MALLPIFLIVLVDIFALTLVIPLLAIYAERFTATPLEATLLVSTFAACQLVSGPLLGRISDRVGRKPLLVVSQIGTFIGLVLMAQATSLWMLFVARVIDGSTAGNLSLAQAYIADNTPPERRARAFGLIGIAFGVGFFVGPFVTGALSVYGLSAPIWAAAGLSLTSVVLTSALLPNGVRPAQAATLPERGGSPRPAPLTLFAWSAYGQFFARADLRPRLAQFFCYMFAFSTFTSGFALFAERTFKWQGEPFSPREIGYLFAYSGFLGILLQGGFIGRLVKRFGEAALVSAGFATLVVGYAVLSQIHDVGLLIAVIPIASFGNGVLRPALTSLISRAVDKHEQGVILGLTQSLNSVAAICAPPLAGALISRGLLGGWALCAGAAALLGLLTIPPFARPRLGVPDDPGS